jgi:hypothetical protein
LEIDADTDKRFRSHFSSFRLLMLTPRSISKWHMRLAPQLCIPQAMRGQPPLMLLSLVEVLLMLLSLVEVLLCIVQRVICG